MNIIINFFFLLNSNRNGTFVRIFDCANNICLHIAHIERITNNEKWKKYHRRMPWTWHFYQIMIANHPIDDATSICVACSIANDNYTTRCPRCAPSSIRTKCKKSELCTILSKCIDLDAIYRIVLSISKLVINFTALKSRKRHNHDLIPTIPLYIRIRHLIVWCSACVFDNIVLINLP